MQRDGLDDERSQGSDERRSSPPKRQRTESVDTDSSAAFRSRPTGGQLKSGGSSSDEDDQTMMMGNFVTELGPHDVLVGRGLGPNEHQGNVSYRETIGMYTEEYLATSKRREKDAIARRVVREIGKRGGRFIKKIRKDDPRHPQASASPSTDIYVLADPKFIVEKTKQALRFHGRNPQTTSSSREAIPSFEQTF